MALLKNADAEFGDSEIAKIEENRFIRDIVKRVEQKLRAGFYRPGANGGDGLVYFTDVELEFRND